MTRENNNQPSKIYQINKLNGIEYEVLAGTSRKLGEKEANPSWSNRMWKRIDYLKDKMLLNNADKINEAIKNDIEATRLIDACIFAYKKRN